MFNKLGGLLGGRLGKQDELSRQLQIVKVLDLYRAETKKIFPNQQGEGPISVKDKVLTVSVESAAAASEMRYLQESVIRAINQAMGYEAVKKIIYRF